MNNIHLDRIKLESEHTIRYLTSVIEQNRALEQENRELRVKLDRCQRMVAEAAEESMEVLV